LRYGLAATLLLVPSSLMGLTFPCVIQAADPQARAGGGALYAANTAGAMLGCLLAGFIGIGLLGIRGTAEVAAFFNLLCGATACWLFRGDPTPTAVVEEPLAPNAPDGHRVFALLVAAGLSGASALAAEILWTRALLPYVNSSSYAFAAIMVCYLAGLAIGAAWVASRCARLRVEDIALRWLLCQITLAVFLAFSPLLMRMVEALLPLYVGIRRVQSLSDWLAMVAGVFAKSSLVVLPATLLMGASLPLCIALMARAGCAGGRAAGLVSAVNTLGGLLGSVAAGFVLLPVLGSSNSLLVVGLGNVAGALLVWLPQKRTRRQNTALSVALAAAVLLAWLAHSADRGPFLGRLASGGRVLLVDEGPQDTTAVVERTVNGVEARVIISNGVSYAGDEPMAQRYMALLGHLPLLLSEDASRALVICVGTGTTAANLALYPEVQSLDLVDISPAVHKTLPLFVRVNHQVWADPRATIHEADGRQFMTRALRGYGVITLEPPPPRAAGAASLYTLGLYERARSSLNPGGVIAQWLPLHGMTESEILMLARTFQRIFPEAALFLLNPDEAALLGSAGPLSFDSRRVQQRLQDKAVRAALQTIGFDTDDPAQLAAMLLALAPVHGAALRALVGEGPVVTDDRPLIEQFVTLLADRRRFDPDGRRGLLRRLAATDSPLPVLGAPLPALAAAQARVRGQFLAWLRAAEAIEPWQPHPLP
jgi:spermidine synthase